MILVDTSVWVDHFRSREPQLVSLLSQTQVLGHPFVTGELALGNLHQRELVLRLLDSLPQASMATVGEVARFIQKNALSGLGIGYVDVHLLASTLLTPGALLWTRDKRLLALADKFAISADFAG